MKTSKEGKRNEQSLQNDAQNDFLASSELHEVNDILNQWKNREDIQINILNSNNPGNSFLYNSLRYKR